MLGYEFPIDVGSSDDDPTGIAVETCMHEHVGPFGIGVTAQHADRVKPYRSGVDNSDRPPNSAGFGQGWAVWVLIHTGDCSPWTITRRRTGHFNSEDMIGAETTECCHIKGVRSEVALRVTEVGAVEPDIGLVEDAVELDPPASAFIRRLEAECSAVEQWAVPCWRVGHCGPVSRHLDGGPLGVVGIEPDQQPSIAVGNG